MSAGQRIPADAWGDAFPGIYRAEAAKNRARRERRRLADRARRQAPAFIAEERTKLAEARERIADRHAAAACKPGLWPFIQYQAKAGDPDAKRVWRADCAEVWDAARQERRERDDALLAELRAQHGSGLPSDEHAILKLYVAKVPQARRLLVGQDKAHVAPATRKVIGLYAPYVVANAAMCGVLRVDIDRVFVGGFAELTAVIAALGVPLPNIVVGHVDAAGRLHHPHLIWLLDASVAATGKARKAPQGLLTLVLRGLTAALLPIGADPGGVANRLRMKNPLSPAWSCAVVAEVPYCLAPDPRPNASGFVALAPALDRAGGYAQLKAASEARAGKPILADHPDPAIAGQSNALFGHLRTFARRCVGWHRAHGSEAEFHHELAAEALRVMPGGRASEKAARATAKSVAAWTWANYHGRPAKPRCATPEERQERQAAAGRATGAARGYATLAAIIEARQRLAAAGRRPTQAEVAVIIGRTERTVRKHWPAALAVAAKPEERSPPIDKKGAAPSSGAAPAAGAIPEVHRGPNPPTPFKGVGRGVRHPGGSRGWLAVPLPPSLPAPAMPPPRKPHTSKAAAEGGGEEGAAAIAAGGGRVALPPFDATGSEPRRTPCQQTSSADLSPPSCGASGLT